MKKQIKNILWDVDGVLANLNYAYFNFLKNHPNYKDKYGDLKWEDLDKALPIVPKYGALELKTHPELGVQMDKDFCASYDFFSDRPLYDGALEMLKHFYEKGFKQVTASSTFDVETKRKFINELLGEATKFVAVEAVKHGAFMHDSAKVGLILYCCEQYNLDPEETILIDDRCYNHDAARESGIKSLRYRCEFTTDAPEGYEDIPEVNSYKELIEWIDNYNNSCE